MSVATFIAPTTAVASTLETGDIIQVTAWGGNEYGYAYTFALDGREPPGVAIDTDTGRISISIALAVGSYTFGIVATNREDGNYATFSFTLTVLQGIVGTIGVTTPTTSQIVHITYDPGSGTWGSPSGNDWSAVFASMKTAILADQTRCNAAWDGSLRVDIPLQRGTEYDYTNNTWLTGIQYFTLHDVGSGALPSMKCTFSGVNDVSKGPLAIGWPGTALGPGNGGAVLPPPPPVSGVKANAATIATTAVGNTTVTLLNAGDASKIKAGRWHLICSQCIQLGGWPPNCMWIDYVKVVSVAGTTVTLDRPLKYIHRQDFWEDSTDDGSLGMARIIPYDTGGAGGYTPSDPRCGIRCSITNVTLLKNTNFSAEFATQVVGTIDFTFSGCLVRATNPSQVKHILYLNCTLTGGGEWDKLSETAMHDGCASAAFDSTCDRGSGTSFMYLLFRNSHIAPMQISPRQLRVMGGSNIDALGDTYFLVPFTFSYNGACLYWDFENCTLQGSSGAAVWAFGQNPQTGTGNTMGFILGTDCSWSGNTLVFPENTSQTGSNPFQDALVKVFEGMIIDSGNGRTPLTTNWGYVTKVYSPGNSTAMWLDVTWVNGSKPTTGTIWFHRLKHLNWSSVTLGTAGGVTTGWNDPGFTKTIASPNANYDYPSGYPAPYNDGVASSFADGVCAIMSTSQMLGTGVDLPSNPTYVNGSCVMMQSSSLLGTGLSGAAPTGQLTFTITSATATVSIIH